MRTRILKLLSIFLLGIIFLSGCGQYTMNNHHSNTKVSNSRPQTEEKNKTVTIAASFYPVYIFTLNIAANIPDVKVIDMTKPTTGCLHDYAVTPEDMKNLEGAKFLVISGAGTESFMSKVIKQFPDLKIIDSSRGIPLIKGSGNEGDNPHIWVSISDAIMQVRNIGKQLAAMDPDHADQYQANTEAYVAKLAKERNKMHRGLQGVKHRDIITFHEAFPYFAREFGLNIAGVIEREPGSEPSARELGQTVEKINKLKVKAIFTEPQYPAESAQTIARETGCKVYTLDPVVSGPMNADAYIDIMDSNYKTLKEALQ